MRDELDADTKELLKGVRSDARSAYYGDPGAKLWFLVWGVMLCLAVAASGLLIEQPMGSMVSIIGISCLVLIAFWLTWRS